MTDIDQTAPEQLEPNSSPPIGTITTRLCHGCRFRPEGGVGECKNPACIDQETNRLRHVQNENVACEHYVAAQEFTGFDIDAEMPLIVP